MRVMQALSIVQKDVQELDSVKKITFLIGFALVNEMVGYVFPNFKIHFMVRNAWILSEKSRESVIFSQAQKSYTFTWFFTQNSLVSNHKSEFYSMDRNIHPFPSLVRKSY